VVVVESHVGMRVGGRGRERRVVRSNRERKKKKEDWMSESVESEQVVATSGVRPSMLTLLMCCVV
jgi:hypothetical protein